MGHRIDLYTFSHLLHPRFGLLQRSAKGKFDHVRQDNVNVLITTLVATAARSRYDNATLIAGVEAGMIYMERDALLVVKTARSN